MRCRLAVDVATLGERQIDLGRDVVDGVAVSGREEVGDDEQGRQSSRGLAVWRVGTRSGRRTMESDRICGLGFFFPYIGIAVQNDVVLH